MSEETDVPTDATDAKKVDQPATAEEEKSPDDIFYFVACVGFF